MNKYLILITILVLLYLYWKYQQTKSNSPPPDEIIERKGKDKELFDEAEDFDLNSDEEHQTSGYGVAELPPAKFIPVNQQPVRKSTSPWPIPSSKKN